MEERTLVKQERKLLTSLNKCEIMVFEERQRFRQKYLWLFLILFSLGSVFYLYHLNDFDAIGSILVILSTVFALFYFAELRTRVDEDGVQINFFPFHLSDRKIGFEEIERFSSEEYSPVKEFGGWGLRWRPGKFAYNVSGNRGVRIIKNNGKELMIGSQSPEELEKAIEEEMD